MKEKNKILVIIPAYNEQENIIHTIDHLKNEIKDRYNINYVVVNDCSKDSTAYILKERQENFIDLPLNLGIGGGMQTGYKYAFREGYDVAIQMDGDGQHLPEYIGTLLKPLENGEADFVVGSRFIKKEGFQSSWQRRMGINFLSNLIYICTGQKIKDVTSGFRAANKKTIELFVKDYAVDYPEPESLVACAVSGIRIKEVPVQMQERVGGVSSISAVKSIYYMIKVSIAIILKKTIWNKGVKK